MRKKGDVSTFPALASRKVETSPFFLSRAILIIFFLICGAPEAFCGLPQSATLDTYFQDFSNFIDGATIDGTDYWNVFSGSENNAIAQSKVTPGGTGNSVELIGALNVPVVDRPFAYGGHTPTWIRFKIRPSISNQTPSVPSSGVGAVCFDFTGNVLVADGSSWVDTGATYVTGQWYDVSMKLDFINHTYDLYFVDPNSDIGFSPLETNLGFIDNTINSLSDLKFYGTYSASGQSNAYVDDIEVSYIYRLQIISAPQKLMQGQVSGPIVLQLQDSDSAPQTAATDITLELKSTSTSGSFSLNKDPWVSQEQIIIPKSAQQVTFYYKDTASGRPVINVREYPDRGYLDALQEFEIVNKFARFAVEAATPQVAGQSFDIIITAKDEKANTDESYGGAVNLSLDYISPAKGSFPILPDNVSGFVKGVLKVTTAKYPDCGLVTITATDSEDSDQTGASSQILFLPASFIVSAESPQIVSNPFKVSVTALNAAGLITPNYNSAVNLLPLAVTPLSIPKASFSPSVIAASSFLSGIAKADVSYNLYGTIKLKAEDSVDPAKSGISPDIVFLPKSMSISVIPANSERDFFYIGEPIEMVVKVLDALGGPIPNYPGAVELSSGIGLALPGPYTFTGADAGAHTFSAVPAQAGSYTVVAQSQKGSLSVESSKITVKNATIEVIDTTSPVGTGEVTIQIVDDEGNVITSESGLTVNVEAVEDSDNGSASLAATSARFTNGKITLSVTDSEAETVTILVSSSYKIKTRKGAITFGRAGKTGINQLMWRELKNK
ncbi:MAG: DUF6701 domain-containing protein [Candidatus Omnitrophota bacterium]